jgi:alpha-N-acetylglucosaminidase
LQPSTTGLTNRTGHHGTALFYDPKQVTTAWELLLNATFENPALLDIPTFHNDMVDVTRQVFQNAFIDLYDELISSWNSSSINVTQVQSNGGSIVDFLSDLDRVLGADETFILGKWISDARRWSSENDLYADFLEYNARNQVSLFMNRLMQ